MLGTWEIIIIVSAILLLFRRQVDPGVNAWPR